jgi:Protein of unknown function (DUF1565)
MNTTANLAGRRRPAALAAAALAVGLLALASPASARAATINVSAATGNDANPGSASAPLKTLTRALARARAGDTVKLAGGVYSQEANGEKYSTTTAAPTIVVRSGVTIRGDTVSPSRSTLIGAPNEVGLVLRGNATVTDVSLFEFGVGVQASQGTQTLQDLDFSRGGIRLTGTADATLTSRVVNFRSGRFRHIEGAAVSVNDQSRFTMDGGAIFGDGTTGGSCITTAKGIFASGSAHVTLRNGALIEDVAGGALDLTASARATVTETKVIARYPDGCVPLPSLRTLESAALVVQNSRLESNGRGSSVFADGIRALSSAPLTIKDSRIDGYNSDGVEAGPLASQILISGSTLEGNRTAVNARDATSALVSVAQSSVINSGEGIVAPSLKLRRSSVFRNNTGVVATRGLGVDLGTASDPGLNTFRDNTPTSVDFDPSVTLGGVSAVGNAWNPSEQGADVNGCYVENRVVTGADPRLVSAGHNFLLRGLSPTNRSIELGGCPIGTFDVSPRTLTARPGRPASWRLAWTHPVDWKRLDRVVLRLESLGKPVGRIVLDQQTRRLRASGPAVQLVRGRGRISGRAGGKRMTARLVLRIAKRYAGRTLIAKLAARDDDGNRQPFRCAGRVKVLSR